MSLVVFNGCSFVAGDALTWDRHYPDVDVDRHIWSRETHPTYSAQDIKAMSDHYWTNLRPLDNLPTQTARLLGSTAVDLSQDGNSNRAIAISTIDYLSQLDCLDGVTVCIGWTEPTRRLVWDAEIGQLINLSIHRLIDRAMPRIFRDYINLAIVSADEMDHVIDYITHVQLLTSYLESRSINYVFWRSMGQPIDTAPLARITQYGTRSFNPQRTLDHSRWLALDQHAEPWKSSSWFEQLTPTDTISNFNRHPNLSAVSKMSHRLADRLAELAVKKLP